MHYFEEGFVYNKPSWHQLETLVLDRLVLPDDREEAMRLAGHDFKVIELMNGNAGRVIDDPDTHPGDVVRINGEWHTFDHRKDKKGLYINQLRDGIPGPVHGNFLEVVNASLQVIPNSVGWDILEAIFEAGAKLETGMTLKGGALCVVTIWLDEPFKIPGDDSVQVPYGAARWAHDGTGALNVRSFITRIVCANTDAIAESEAKRLGTDYTFKHTKNWKDRVADAKMAIKGIRVQAEEYQEMVDELCNIHFTETQRELFITQQLIPAPPEYMTSKRVQTNIEVERTKLRAIFASPTIPEAHKYTGYGFRLAGVEYLDHKRGWRNRDTYVGRQLLRTEPVKTKLNNLIRELVKYD